MTVRRTEARHADAEGLQTLPAAAVLGRLLKAQVAAMEAVGPALPAIEAAAVAAADALQGGGRMAYCGAGSAGLMALSDCLELAGTFGIAPDRSPMLLAGGRASLLDMRGAAEDDAAQAEADLARFAPRKGDVVICVSASGSTPYTLLIAGRARAAGAVVIGIANAAGSALLRESDIAVLLDTGPEMVAGSTRLGAGTAQKIALNMLSVMVGLHLGHVHDGYMVNLVADNAKLADRAARIVAAVAKVDRAAAEAALARTDGAVKPAILVARGATPAAATAAIDSHRGHLGPALACVTDDGSRHHRAEGPPTGRRS